MSSKRQDLSTRLGGRTLSTVFYKFLCLIKSLNSRLKNSAPNWLKALRELPSKLSYTDRPSNTSLSSLRPCRRCLAWTPSNSVSGLVNSSCRIVCKCPLSQPTNVWLSMSRRPTSRSCSSCRCSMWTRFRWWWRRTNTSLTSCQRQIPHTYRRNK